MAEFFENTVFLIEDPLHHIPAVRIALRGEFYGVEVPVFSGQFYFPERALTEGLKDLVVFKHGC